MTAPPTDELVLLLIVRRPAATSARTIGSANRAILHTLDCHLNRCGRVDGARNQPKLPGLQIVQRQLDVRSWQNNPALSFLADADALDKAHRCSVVHRDLALQPRSIDRSVELTRSVRRASGFVQVRKSEKFFPVPTWTVCAFTRTWKTWVQIFSLSQRGRWPSALRFAPTVFERIVYCWF